MLRISKLTDYATVILARLASGDGRHQTAASLAEATGLAATTVSKLLKQLNRAGMVESMRGLHGGYRLARPPERISAAAILDALEGPLALTECSTSDGHCDLAAHCTVSSTWQRINRAIQQSLEEVTLADLAGIENTTRRFALFDLRLRSGLGRGVAR